LAPVVAAAGDGDHPTCLQGLDARHIADVVGGRSTGGVRLPDAVHAAARQSPPPPRGRGRPQQWRPAPRYEAKAVLEALPEARWHTIPWRERDAVALRNQCVAVRVHWATGGPQFSTRPPRVCTGPEGWWLGERPLPGARGAVQWDGRTLPADTPLHRLVEVAHSRWPLEPCYADAKGACGLDHDQGRRWHGLHRPLALVMLASSFLARQRWMPADPAGFSPLGGASVLPGGPSPGAAVAFQDVVLWFIATDQIAHFRPRRI
jgi:SRSO17 transposase